MPIDVLFTTLNHLFHRVILETSASLIEAITQLWLFLVDDCVASGHLPIDCLVLACVGHANFWLCQAMQPSRMAFPSHLINMHNYPSGEMTLNGRSDNTTVTNPKLLDSETDKHIGQLSAPLDLEVSPIVAFC
ncbi:unnamed protein product [Protopolystoma xenopodis]|uniref:Uncharacterized protein n=1 Tax=Protopolystoma xenopodis TaxID=117903 RepID=A0A3S5B357_9PLAT|nr:unnamed protein product [Protopolystoma xenopodis]